MSIPYDTDDKTPLHEGFVGMTEYERRSEKAHKELEDYLEHERSLKRQTSHKSHEGDSAVPEKEESQDKSPLESQDDCLHKDWWTKTDNASLNEAPDKALEEEANTKHIDDHYSYKPQFEVSGHVPPYMQQKAANNAPPLKPEA